MTNDQAADDMIAQTLSIWRAGVDAVRGDAAVAARVALHSDRLTIGPRAIPRSAFDSLLVVGAGKATAAMAGGLVRQLGDAIPIRGRINVPRGTAAGWDLHGIQVCEAREPGSNEPTELAVAGTEAILRDVAGVSPRELVIVLLSGGGSALWVAPVAGVSWQDKLAVTRHLSAAGASITQLNAVRKRLSRIKGGGLRRACSAARMLTLVLSDVIGDPLDTIASGPTVRDGLPDDYALQVLQRADPERRMPAAIYEALGRERIRVPGEAAWVDDVIVIGNNATATAAAGTRARQLGYDVVIEDASGDEGTAEEVGERMADQAIELLRGQRDRSASPLCRISGGEPVVRLVEPRLRGRGGRNQQLVLAAMRRLAEHPDFRPQDRGRLVLLSGGTDGEDGPTDAAGAILCREVWDTAERLGLSAEDHLRRNDAYSFFKQAGGLMLTGPTGTNVCDVRALTVRPDGG